MRIILFLLLPLFAFGQTRYVTATAVPGNDGTSEANAWTMAEALANDVPGMTVYVKAGAYAPFVISSSGTSGNYIKYIGYDNTAGDIVTTNGSTYERGDNVSSAVMPLVTVPTNVFNGINVTGNYVHVENFQITGAGAPSVSEQRGVISNGFATILDNIVVSDMGTFTTYSKYDGKGILVFGDNFIIRDSYVEDCTAEGYNVVGGDNGLIQRSYAYASNAGNPMDYYFNIANGATGNIVETSTAYREPPLAHGGHGLNIKDLATNNTFRNCNVFHTGIEANFSGVQNNTFQDINIYGTGTSSSQWASRIFVANGAQNNTFRNIFLKDVYCAIQIADYNDFYVGPGGDRDLARTMDNTVFENIVVENGQRFLETQFFNGGVNTAPGNGNIFRNISLYNIQDFFVLQMPFTNVQLHNIGINTKTGTGSVFVLNGNGSITQTSGNNKYFNASGTFPTGWDSTTDPLFVSAGGGSALNYRIATGSPWINAGSTANGSTTSFDGAPIIGNRDVGAFEFSSGTDETPPSVATRTVTLVTEQSFTVDWTTDEASKGRIYFDTDTGTVAGDYASQTGLESGFLTRHIQSPGPGNPSALNAGTTYYYRIYTEDAAGNTALSTEFTQATLGAAPDPDPPALIGKGVKSRNLKKRKF